MTLPHDSSLLDLLILAPLASVANGEPVSPYTYV